MNPPRYDRKQSDMLRRINFTDPDEGKPALYAILGAIGMYAFILLMLSL